MNLKNHSSQQGFVLISIIIFIALIVAIVYYGLPISNAYLDKQKIQASIQTSLADKNNVQLSAREMKNRIIKTINVKNLTVDQNLIIVKKENNKFDIIVPLKKTVEITSKINFVIDFTIKEKTPE